MSITFPDIMTTIRQRQARRLKTIDGSEPLPEHSPEMLYIGCVDARLDPVKDIGIPQGKALIYRNIGALVPPHGNGTPNPEAISVGAVLEFFLKEIKAKDGKTKHIVISGHTCCGGVAHACQHQNDMPKQEGFLMRYLSLLTGAISHVFGSKPDAKDDPKMRQVEHESVRRSVANLMKYDVVKDAIAAHQVEIHGWVIDTATQRIEEMEKDKEGKFTGNFVEMSENRQAQIGRV